MTHAFAQQSRGASEAGKWEIEVHGGSVWVGNPTGATTTMPAPSEAFTTRNNRPSQVRSSWYFGDGAMLLNQQGAAFTLPRTARITSLDPLSQGRRRRAPTPGASGFESAGA